MRLDVAANSECRRETRDKRRMLIAPVGLKLLARHLRSPTQAEDELDHPGEPTCSRVGTRAQARLPGVAVRTAKIARMSSPASERAHRRRRFRGRDPQEPHRSASPIEL